MAKILVIDDDTLFREAAEMILSDGGHLVAGAGSGAEARKKLAEGGGGPYDLILLDIELGDITGTALLKQIREGSEGFKAQPALPVLMISGHADPQNIAGAAKIGVQGFIVKPCGGAVLLDRVKSVLSKAGASHA
jgi:DNA-binding response OmpR family regulator